MKFIRGLLVIYHRYRSGIEARRKNGKIEKHIESQVINMIVIDAGHGGRDSGASHGDLEEKTPALSIALMLAGLLEAAGKNVFLTRDTDEFISLQRRSELANKANAHIFISIHHNGHTDVSANGIETYHYPGSDKGQEYAQSIQQSLVDNLNLRNRGVKQATFSVLKYTRAPAVLLEIGFISNKEEREKLKNCDFLFKAAKSIKEVL